MALWRVGEGEGGQPPLRHLLHVMAHDARMVRGEHRNRDDAAFGDAASGGFEPGGDGGKGEALARIHPQGGDGGPFERRLCLSLHLAGADLVRIGRQAGEAVAGDAVRVRRHQGLGGGLGRRSAGAGRDQHRAGEGRGPRGGRVARSCRLLLKHLRHRDGYRLADTHVGFHGDARNVRGEDEVGHALPAGRRRAGAPSRTRPAWRRRAGPLSAPRPKPPRPPRRRARH